MIWNILTIRPLCEMKADKALREIGYNTMLPLDYKFVRKADDKAVVRSVPLMPGYLVMGSDREPAWREIRELKDGHGWALVRGFLGVENRPYRLDGMSVSYIRGLCDVEPPKAVPSQRGVSVGDIAIIVDGPYAGQRCPVRRVVPKKQRATVMLNIFGTLREFQIDTKSLELAVDMPERFLAAVP